MIICSEFHNNVQSGKNHSSRYTSNQITPTPNFLLAITDRPYNNQIVVKIATSQIKLLAYRSKTISRHFGQRTALASLAQITRDTSGKEPPLMTTKTGLRAIADRPYNNQNLQTCKRLINATILIGIGNN